MTYLWNDPCTYLIVSCLMQDFTAALLLLITVTANWHILQYLPYWQYSPAYSSMTHSRSSALFCDLSIYTILYLIL